MCARVGLLCLSAWRRHLCFESPAMAQRVNLTTLINMARLERRGGITGGGQFSDLEIKRMALMVYNTESHHSCWSSPLQKPQKSPQLKHRPPAYPTYHVLTYFN